MVMPYHLHMPSYFLETFTEYPQLFFSFPDVRIHVYYGLTHWYFYPPRRIDIRSFGMLEPTTRHNYRFVHIGI